MAGFFINKPDFLDEEWQSLCDSMMHGTGAYTFEANLSDDAFICEFGHGQGFWSSSGFGDGCYPVYAYYRDGESLPVGLSIVFIDEEDEGDD